MMLPIRVLFIEASSTLGDLPALPVTSLTDSSAFCLRLAVARLASYLSQDQNKSVGDVRNLKMF
jgi:hypothetical protein